MYVRRKVALSCPTCKAIFSRWHYEVRRGSAKFCSRRCVRRTAEVKSQLSLAKSSEKNPMWKGDAAGLDALHIWVAKRLPRPKLCSDCGVKPPLDLANKGVYDRSLENWEWLCRRCHMVKDGRLTKFLASRKKKMEHDKLTFIEAVKLLVGKD